MPAIFQSLVAIEPILIIDNSMTKQLFHRRRWKDDIMTSAWKLNLDLDSTKSESLNAFASI